jgi:predicted HTH transcriptional regulator
MTELLNLIRKGESSTVQFKERAPHPDSLAHEIIAFSNSKGGMILFGVNDKTGAVNGLTFAEIQQLNQQIVNVASTKVYPPVFLTTETVLVDEQAVVVVSVPEGAHKPYKDSNGTIYLKNGADKRKVTSNEELARLLSSGGMIYADEQPIYGSSIEDVDIDLFDTIIQRKYKKTLSELNLDKKQALANLNLAHDGVLTLAGLLLLSKKRQQFRPLFSVQCVSADGSDLSFIDNESTFDGTLSDVFEQSFAFIGRNMKKVPIGPGFNSQTKWEIPHEVFEELLVNALVHRDYFITATVKVFVYADRVEIVNPGRLPNSLTIENIKNGISIPRNPILVSLAQYTLPYKGLGTGIIRAFSLYPHIIIENQVDENQFKVIIRRPE